MDVKHVKWISIRNYAKGSADRSNVDLGVKIGNEFFMFYNGRSIKLNGGKDGDEDFFEWRPAFKSEYGTGDVPTTINPTKTEAWEDVAEGYYSWQRIPTIEDSDTLETLEFLEKKGQPIPAPVYIGAALDAFKERGYQNHPEVKYLPDDDDHEMQVIAMIAGDIPPQFGAWFNSVVETLQSKGFVTTGTKWTLTQHGLGFYSSWKKQLDGVPYQDRIVTWFEHTFGMQFSDVLERFFRYGEESIELMQAGGVSKADVIELVDYVYSRPVGVVKQELGGTITTLMILCHVLGIDFNDAAETELRHIWGRVDKIRFKQLSKPHASPLPGSDLPKLEETETI